ncbi:MAG: hypothetical protein QOI95_2744 [Acidimicrobiaceae bacterium]
MVGVVVIAFVAFWAYVFFIAPSAPEDKLNDASFPRAAQPVCTNALDDLRAANLLNQPATSPGQRADLVERSDARLKSMVQQLRSLTPANADDGHAVSGWLDDWDQWLSDRATWVTKLRAGQDVSFDEKARDNGEPNSKALVAFAITNEMPACVTPFGI